MNHETRKTGTSQRLTRLGIPIALAMLVLPTVALGNAVQWTEAEGGNGHWYELVPSDCAGSPTAEELVEAGEALGGHLVTFGSEAEWDYVRLSFGGLQTGDPCTFDWFLGLKSEPGSYDWYWVTGEPVVFEAWGTSVCGAGPYPNNQPGSTLAYISNRVDCGQVWDDGVIGAAASNFMVEFSADCNGDGIVDYGQILDGTYPDTNDNGVPDCCDAGEPCDVPGADLTVDDDLLDYPDADFTSIQAAIDASQDGDLILVYPGTYTGTGNHVVNFGTKQLQLIAATGFSNTIIDGEDARGLINCSNYHDASTVIQGFGMTRGNVDGISGLPFASLLEFTGESGPILADCRIYDMDANGYTLHAGPVHLGDAVGHPQILRCIFESINCNYLFYFNYNNPRIEDCIVKSNVCRYVGFSYWSNNRPEYINCVFDGNATAGNDGHGVGFLVASSGSLITTIGCTFSGNTMENSCVINGTAEVGDTQFCGNFPGNDICGSWTDLGGNEFLDECTGFVDCNENGVPDYDDIDNGYSQDCNSDGVPDECQTLSDCDGDGTSDLCEILNGAMDINPADGVPDDCQGAARGACCVGDSCITATADDCFDASGSYAGDGVSCTEDPCDEPCLGDVDGNGSVDVIDILTVLNSWGGCP